MDESNIKHWKSVGFQLLVGQSKQSEDISLGSWNILIFMYYLWKYLKKQNKQINSYWN